MKKSEYDIQAETFMDTHRVTMTTQYLGHFPRLGEYATSQWQVTFTRQGHNKPFSFTFSQSLHDSWVYTEDGKSVFDKKRGLPPRLRKELYPTTGNIQRLGYCLLQPIKIAPTLYSVLACLTKYDPGTFKDFCADFGYSDDSIKALDTYRAVQEEWREVNRMFGDCLDELVEIN